MSMRQLKITKSITNRESQSLEKYLQEIGKVDLLTPEKEVDLAKKIKQGDQIALETLTKANLRFVVSVAKQYQNQGLSLSDLINEGNLGLIEAAKRFDPERNVKFISYAVWWIRQSIERSIMHQARLVRLPVHVVRELNQVLKARRHLESQSAGGLDGGHLTLPNGTGTDIFCTTQLVMPQNGQVLLVGGDGPFVDPYTPVLREFHHGPPGDAPQNTTTGRGDGAVLRDEDVEAGAFDHVSAAVGQDRGLSPAVVGVEEGALEV